MSADRAITEAERDVLKLARRFAKSWAEGDKDPRGNALDLDLLAELCDAVDALPPEPEPALDTELESLVAFRAAAKKAGFKA